MTVRRPTHSPQASAPGGASRIPAPRPRRPRRRGTALIVTMIITFAIAGLVVTLGRSVRAEVGISANQAASRQAAMIQRGAEQYVLALLANERERLHTLDESYFEALPVADGYFWIVRPDYQDSTLPAFGLVDESSKLDLNRAAAEMLERLPGMTQELAWSIVGWRGRDDGASAVQMPSADSKGSRFEAVEELLMVPGMPREVVVGTGPRPPLGNGWGRSTSPRPFSDDRYTVWGISDLVTVWNVQPRPRQRINLNQGPSARNAVRLLLNETLGEQRGTELGARIPNRQFLDVFDFSLAIGMTPDELREIEDRITVDRDRSRGRINVNSAPREVLLTVPGLEPADVDALISHRATLHQERPSMAWVMAVLEQQAAGLGRFLTDQGVFFSADIIAISGDGRAFRRVRIVVLAGSDPRIVYRRDLTEGGWPLDPAIREELREGGQFAGLGLGMSGRGGPRDRGLTGR